MKLLKIVIETNKNYEETTLFPWILPSTENIIIKYDAVPIKYLDKNYIISLSFPYNYKYIHLEEDNNIYKLNLIHVSHELNLSLFSCDKYNDFHYSISDLKYKIPKDNFNDFFFQNNKTYIPIKYLDYFFNNFDAPNLPPFAYFNCKSMQVEKGSVLFNISNNSIYGILLTTYEDHIIIPSLAIKRLLDGINTEFKFSNFFCDYKLYTSEINSGIKIINSNYSNIKKNEVILDLNNLMIIRGNIKYKKIDEWVPIEIYLWYEWLPKTSVIIKTFYLKDTTEKLLEFKDYKSYLNIPLINTNVNSKIMKLSFQLLRYFYEKNIILRNEDIDNYLLNPFKKSNIMIDISEELISAKYYEPTEITDLVIVTK
jgi:NADPH-dependent 7-cyano-7-deazaguanine reductase QueF-like protein